LAVIKYYELRNKSVLVLCPKKLGANWTNYNANLVTNIFAKDRFSYDVLYHTDLSRKGGETLGIDLAKINWGNYDLVVIDESHNFRNRGTFKDRETRYDRLMNQVIRQGVKTKVLMLSATPVNNHFTDLKNQLALAYEGNAALLENKLDTERDIETIFRRAQASFNAWAKLDPAQRTTQAILNLLDFDFFKLVDSVTIARSRKHIQTFYDTKIFKVTRSESVIKHIINAERYFWECVEKDTPPDVDASESAAKAIQQLYPQHIPLTVEDLSHNEQANQLFAQLIQEKHHIEQHQNNFDETKHQIQMLMRDAERATFANGSVTWKK
jgi:hypothetical protein